MNQTVIENPVIKSQLDEPKCRIRFSDEGITNEIVEIRRVSSYPITILVVNNHGAHGWREFMEIPDPWDAKNTIRQPIQPK